MARNPFKSSKSSIHLFIQQTYIVYYVESTLLDTGMHNKNK